jgi:hypothetical protein
MRAVSFIEVLYLNGQALRAESTLSGQSIRYFGPYRRAFSIRDAGPHGAVYLP